MKKFLWILALCSSGLFFSKNVHAQCIKDTSLTIQEEDSCQYNDITLYISKNGYNWIYGKSYLWSNGSTSQNQYSLTSGTFMAIITDSATGCKDTLSKTIVDDTCHICDGFEVYISEKDSCSTNDLELSAYNWPWRVNVEFTWSTGKIDTPIFPSFASLRNRSTGTYSVIARDIYNGCLDTAYITIVDDTCNLCDSFKIGGNISVSDGCSYNDVRLAPVKWGGSNNFSYLWSSGDTMDTIHNKTSGSYFVIITDRLYGCKDTINITVKDDTCNLCYNFRGYLYKYDSCQTNDAKVYAYFWGGSGNYSYLWNTGSTASILTNKSTGWYKVTITDIVNGCIRKDSIYVFDSTYKCCKAYIHTSDSSVGATKSFLGYTNFMDSTQVSGTTYNWTFGDGGTGSGQSQTHTYTSQGSKTVCLYVHQTTSGCRDTTCITVSVPPPGKNLRISHYGSRYIRPLNWKQTFIFYRNIGTTTENVTIEYHVPAGSSLDSSSVSPTSNVGNKITFNLGSLAPGNAGNIYLTLYVPSSYTLGDYKCDTARILTITGDIDASDNTSAVCDQVVASYDPNDKTPYPLGEGADGNISPDSKEINYLINFQNEGNWRTYKVRVEDVIDPAFDISSLSIGDISHPFRMVKLGRKLIWYFDEIELTPKSQDEKRSKGYIQYTLKLNSNLALGTKIKNTAQIYFDDNEAIITNTTKNTLKNTDGSASVRAMNAYDMLDFNWSLNGDKLTLFSPSRMQALRIFNISGKLLLEKEMQSHSEEFDNVRLSQGIYIIHVDIDNQTIIKKIKF